jgi:hypothetical protein
MPKSKYMSGQKNYLSKCPVEECPIMSSERFNLMMAIVIIRAQSYVELVRDMDSQKAFATVLNELAIRAVQGYTGIPDDLIGYSDPIPEVEEIVRHWTTEGYKRIRAHKTPAVNESSTGPPGDREAQLSPILKSKGFTPGGWATAAGLDPSVVYDYLAGKSNPRPSTRKTLAEALGMKPDDLPE